MQIIMNIDGKKFTGEVPSCRVNPQFAKYNNKTYFLNKFGEYEEVEAVEVKDVKIV